MKEQPKPAVSPHVAWDFTEIEYAPDSFEAVIAYGKTPLGALGNLARGMLDVQSRFTELVADINGQDTLSFVNNCETLGESLKLLVEEAEAIAEKRTRIAEDLGEYIHSSAEVLRRYDEDYIPREKKLSEKTKNPEGVEFFENIVHRRSDFVERVGILKDAHEQCEFVGVQLRQIIDVMKDQSRQFDSTAKNTVEEWKNMEEAIDDIEGERKPEPSKSRQASGPRY